jgi:ABC-type nitrate/sulfonate/bicarbonate transport system permease component
MSMQGQLEISGMAEPMPVRRAGTWGRVWRGAVGLIGFFLVWEVVGHSGLLNKLFFVPVSRILPAAWEMYASGFIFEHIGYTVGNFAVGFAIGVIMAVPFGLLLGWNRKLLEFFDPIISVALATPVIVLVPLVIVIFGIFWESKVAISVWSAFFPVLVATIAGVQGVDEGLVKVARSFQASNLKIIRDVVIPGAVPALVSGLRLGMTKGLIGALAAEFFGSQRGLGFLAFSYGTAFQPEKMFVAVLTMAVVGVALTEMIKSVQRRFDVWRPERM